MGSKKKQYKKRNLRHFEGTKLNIKELEDKIIDEEGLNDKDIDEKDISDIEGDDEVDESPPKWYDEVSYHFLNYIIKLMDRLHEFSICFKMIYNGTKSVFNNNY